MFARSAGRPARRPAAVGQTGEVTAAHRFYTRLGFVASHEGMKLALGQ